ncbi:MAG: helix-turn-helix domain-containing protein [Butyrivibrio sp.]
MTLGEKLYKLRRENNFTQEQLADTLGVSRQAISKWESDTAFPETDRLIKISELFGCSLDYLLKNNGETQSDADSGFTMQALRRNFEKKSDKTICGMPLFHIGKNAHGFFALGLNAKGVIAIGLKARGILSFGMLSIGIFSFGFLSIGLIAAGLLAIGVLAAGCFAAGIFAFGAICFGIISCGAVAAGDFAVGALARGKYFALGDDARAMVALGDSRASGTVFEKLGEATSADYAAAKQCLNEIVPRSLSWAKTIIGWFI